MNGIIEFDTSRLHLRQWRQADRAPFATLNADPEVMAYFPKLMNSTESDAVADRCQSLIADRGWGFWAVELRETESFVGFMGLNITSDTLPFLPCVEIGWRLARDYWGSGFATEAAMGALRVGFGTLDLLEIVAFTALTNQRSRRVMERLGMRDTSTQFEHPALPEGHPLRVHTLYRLSREDWLLQREKLTIE